VTPQPDPCATTAAPAKQVPANKFPFPGEPASSTEPATAPSREDVPSAPGAPAATPDSVKKFPFPGESAASSSSSSSSSSGADATTADPDANPATPGLTDKGSEGAPPAPGRHILHRVNPIGTKLQSNDERESEDLSVAQFYMQSGDVKGAYLRSQDAVKMAPDDPDAHFLLAETALKLNKKDEAIAEYNACLKLDPIEKEAKDARKALARLKP
jgi:tetratricopeptide (TPR) repeat protein